MKIVFISAVLLAVVASAVSPSFCKGLECPKFETLGSGPNYEIRKYEPAYWATVSIDSMEDYRFVQARAFQILFRYISGENVEKQKIEMTAPVRDQIIPGAGPFCNSTFMISFFVPFKFQSKPPTPTNPLAKITLSPEMTVGVYSFGGFVSDWNSTVVANVLKLGQALDQANIKYTTNTLFVNGYDSPFTIFDRHNEIWLPVSTSELRK